MGKRTPLFSLHQQNHARFIDFHGWEMPLHYGSQLAEHHAVRENVGLFDVSHMTVIDLLGAGGRQYLRHVLANDIDKIGLQQALYSCMLNHQGGVIDDLIAYMRQSDNFRLVLNSATKERDMAWLLEHTNGLALGIQSRDDVGIVALQGPNSAAELTRLLPGEIAQACADLAPFGFIEHQQYFISRTGYTGEDGFEIVLPHHALCEFWQRALTLGIQPCGLGARDSLRLEAGLMLQGQDMDESVTPYEAALGWTVALEPSNRDFIGRVALECKKEKSFKDKLVGLVLTGKGVMRHGHRISAEGIGEGVVTSGGYSPTLGCSIALARVPKDTEHYVMVSLRGQQVPAKVVKPRFVKQGQILVEVCAK